ncbi:tRNA preQ1(34) S-adenosylmethionine ribosyltransferase-isomerase QueA [soil metagenome]
MIDSALQTSDFSYDLPPQLIAQHPVEPRDASRLMVLDNSRKSTVHATFRDLASFLGEGDVVVANNSRVVHARLHAERVPTGGRVELLILRRGDDGCWDSLAKPARRILPGQELLVRAPRDSGLDDTIINVVSRGNDGTIRLSLSAELERQVDTYGVPPLPPYIHEPLSDPERYQTIFASRRGSSAAPTAGLHVTPDVLHSLAARGIVWVETTLHVGLDTFRPVEVKRVADHHIHSEWCSVSDDAAAVISRARPEGRRVIALGTTSARTLESLGLYWKRGGKGGLTGSTRLFITPGYEWTVVDGLITNFHLPRSSLLMMVSALTGRDRLLEAYQIAIQERYRFYSFGDAMLIL